MTPWDVERHLDKCKDYLERAQRDTHTDSFYPMWLSFVQEHLLRAAINKANPVLGADPKYDGALLAAAGYGSQSNYRTIEMNSVHKRLLSIYPNLADAEKTKIFSVMREMRNAETHSASSGFSLEEGWIVKFYAACQAVLKAIGEDLERIFSADEANAAREMIESLESSIVSSVNKEIAARRKAFKALPPADQTSQLQTAEMAVNARLITSKIPEIEVKQCPSCGAKVIVQGRIIAEGFPTVEDGDFTTRVTVLPIRMDCPSCSLKLSKNSELVIAGLGNQYTALRSEDFDEFIDHYDPDLDYDRWREDR